MSFSYKYLYNMIIIVITLGMAAGWFIGAYLLDKWVNDAHDECNEE
jgi:uncharacterized protein YneF (UPF0154 family)